MEQFFSIYNFNGSAQNDKIVLYFAKNLVKNALEKNLEQKQKKLLWNGIEEAKKMWAGTLFDTVGVVELSYGKFGEFVVEWEGKEERICQT